MALGKNFSEMSDGAVFELCLSVHSQPHFGWGHLERVEWNGNGSLSNPFPPPCQQKVRFKFHSHSLVITTILHP